MIFLQIILAVRSRSGGVHVTKTAYITESVRCIVRSRLGRFSTISFRTSGPNRGIGRIRNLSAVYSVVDAQLDQRQRDYLQRNGKGLFAVRGLRIAFGHAERDHHVQRHLHRRRRIGKPVSHGGGDCRADACDWHDGRGCGELFGAALRLVNSVVEHARNRRRGAGEPGRGHRRSGERQRANMVAGIL